MFKKNHRLPSFILMLLLSIVAIGQWSSCSKYDSDSVGSSFFPSNSLVRLFTHAVYVEFSENYARIWGRYENDVVATIEGTHLTIQNNSDSLALIVYGYPSNSTDCSLTIESNRDYALYINKLTMRSVEQTPIRSKGHGTCYMVIPKNSKNEISTVSAPAVIEHQGGSLVLTGEGELSLTNNAPANVHPVALNALGGLHCQYALKLSLSCPEGDAIRISDGPMRSSLGTWTFDAGQNAISNRSDSIVLIDGTYTGVARDGKFFDNAIGTVIRSASVQGFSGQASDLLDTLQLHQHYDSTLVTLQQHIDTVTVEADSSYVIARLGTTDALATIQSARDMKGLWAILSHQSIQPTDTLIVFKK